MLTKCNGRPHAMPYGSIEDLPDTVKRCLPRQAQEIYREAFNRTWEEHVEGKDREERAHQNAWAAVKKQYKKQREQWVPKSR
jgi:cation transport regulator